MKKNFIPLLFMVLFMTPGSAQVSHLVISQIYGSGGLTGATYQNDFIEIFNPTPSSISLTGYSVQYASSAGTTWSVTTLSGSIGAGKYYLVKEFSAAAIGAALPTADATGSIDLSGTKGKIALVSSITALSGQFATGTGTGIVDFVGYGASNGYEGTNPTAAASNITSVFRRNGGCQDGNDNSADFTTATPSARNSSTAASTCPYISASALTAFGNQCINTTGGPNSFTITGSSLTSANVTIAALSGYTYSTTGAGGTYSAGPLSLTQSGGAYSQVVYVKFTPTTTASYSSNIAIGGGGTLYTVNAAASGTGINTAVAVTTGGSSSITTTSAVAAGSLTAGCTSVTAYGIEYSLVNNFTTGSGTQVASSNLSAGSFSSSLSLLTPGTTYYYRAYATDGSGTVYGSQSSFLTTALIPTLSTSALGSFGNVCTGTTGGPNSFTITGSGLTSANVNVGPLSGFTFSTTSGGTYSSSLSLSQVGGSYSQTIFVDFTPSLAQSYNANIPVNGGGALLAADVSATATGVAPPAQPSAISGSTTPCATTTGNVYSVTNVSGNNYTWVLPTGWVKTAGGTSNSITVTAGSLAGTISVTPNNGYCDGPASTLSVATVIIPAQPSAISGSTAVCAATTGLTYSVTNVSGITYTWLLPSGWSQTAGGTTNSITVTAGSAGGTISVTPSNASCSGTAQTLAVSIGASPSISSVTNSSPVCIGSPLTLTVHGSNFSSYQWSDPSSATSGQVYQQNFNSLPSTGSSVTWTDNSTIPGWYASSNNIGATGLLVGTGSSTTGGPYSFGATSATNRALGSLASNTTGALDYGIKLTNTTGGPVDRVYVQYTGEQWRDGGAGAVPNTLAFSYSINATSITAGTYTNNTSLNYVTTVNSNSGTGAAVDGTLPANQSVKTAVITLGSALASGSSIWLRWTDANDAGSDMGIALDDLTVILYSSAASMLATPSSTISTPTFASSATMTAADYTASNANASGTYTIKVSNTIGCSVTSTTAVTINPLPTPGITGTATACSSVSLTATGGTSYTWSGGSSVGTAANTFSASSTYSVTVTDANGCSATTSQAVNVNPAPAATASNAGPFLPGQTITITSGPSAQTSYAWHGPSGYTASSQNITRTSGTTAMSGTYTVTVTNSSGCSATASTVVAVNGLGDYTWTGATSNVWTVVTNWSPTAPVGGPNGCTENVIIPNTVNDPVISSGISIGNITINDNAQLTLNANLSVCGFLKGGVTTAPLIVGNSHLIMTGTSVQTISGIISANTLEINNTSGGVGNSGNISINKALIMTNGQLGNTGTVTLVSNATGDAYLDNFTSPTAGAFNGNLIVQRYISNSSDGYRDISSPVATTVADLANSVSVFGQDGVHCWYAYNPYPSVQIYREQQTISTGNFFEHWNSYTGINNWLYGMLGIAVRTYAGAPYTISLTGPVYNGNLSVAITHTSSATPASDGWNFIGNPYPSPISWSAVKAMNSAVANGSYYVFHTTAEFAGNWGAHNGVAGVNGASDAIAIGQGFFVNTATSGTFSMNNTVRTAVAASYYRIGALDNEVRLMLSDGANSDEIVTYTDPLATVGYDPDMDAVKMPAGSTVGLAYALPSHDYAINVMDALTAQTELPLTIHVRDTASYVLAAITLNTPGLTAYLKDAQNNTLTSLTNAIPLTLNGGEMYTGRYSVVFREDVTGVANTTEASTHIYAVGNRVYVQRPTSDVATISVINVLGQNITEIPSHSEKTDFTLPADQPWYAIIKVTEGQKVTISKVLVANK